MCRNRPGTGRVRHNRDAGRPASTGHWAGAAPLQEDTCDEAPCGPRSRSSPPGSPSPRAVRTTAARPGRRRDAGRDAATATSAEDFGGMDALVEAAQAEGTLNVIALPPDWANYGEMLDTFSEKYDIEINSASPDGSSQDELNAVESQRGQDRAPDVLDLGTAFARQAQAQDLLAPYQVETWDEIPEDQKDPDGPLVQRLRRLHLHRLQRLGDRRVPDHASPTCSTRSTPARWPSTATRRRPRRRSAASGPRRSPTAAASTTSARASTSSRRSRTPATSTRSRSPRRRSRAARRRIVDRLGLPQRLASPRRSPTRASSGRCTSPATGCSAATTARRSASSPRTRRRPGSGRSSSTATRARTSGSSGGARPVRLPAMEEAGTADADALAALPAGRGHGRVPDRRSRRRPPRQVVAERWNAEMSG